MEYDIFLHMELYWELCVTKVLFHGTMILTLLCHAMTMSVSVRNIEMMKKNIIKCLILIQTPHVILILRKCTILVQDFKSHIHKIIIMEYS